MSWKTGEGATHFQLLKLRFSLVSNQVFKTIKGELIGLTKHSDALKIFGKYGIRAHSQAITMLGYKVKWCGLDPDNAEIMKV